VRKRWWIRETTASDDKFKVVAGPRFWRYRNAREAAARRRQNAENLGLTYKFMIRRVTPDTPPEGKVLLTNKDD
jgi:hypothetical protein